MADIPYIQQAQEVKITGQDSTGTTVNFVSADSNGNLATKDFADGTPGSAVPSVAMQVGGTDGTNLRALSTDTTGKLNINNVSGTVSLPTGAATSANQTNGTQKTQQVDGSGNVMPSGDVVSRPVFVKPGDGTNSITVKAASTAAVVGDTSQVVALSPNTPLPAGTNIIGALSANQSINVAQIAGTNTVTAGVAGLQAVGGNVASGSSDSGNPIKIGAIFNTTLPTVTNGQRVDSQADPNGRHIVTNAPLDGSKPTYSASITGLVAATTPTDIFTITGSATKTVRITRIAFSGTQNTSAARDVLLIKRSAANSGGTSTNPTRVPHDSNSAAATATINAYTANPTSLGAAVGTIRTKRIQILATNVTNPLDTIIWDFGNRPSQAVVLRGTSEVLAINLNSVTSSNNLLDIEIEWTEE